MTRQGLGGVTPFVLASSSPRRRRLLRTLGVRFSVIVPDVDERPLPGELPGAHVRRLALAKARAAARGLPPGSGRRPWVIGADTVVVLDGEILGKPRDAPHAVRMLARLSGRTHEVLTGIALVPAAGGRARSAVVRSRVSMKPLDAATIRRYVAGGEPLGKAGAYAIQGRGRSLVAKVAGSLTNVVGLPLERLARLLEELPRGPAGAPRGGLDPAPAAAVVSRMPGGRASRPGKVGLSPDRDPGEGGAKMSHKKIARRGAALLAAAAVTLFGGGTAGADVTVERAMTNAGFGGMGASTGTMVEKYSGLRRRDTTTMKMGGFLGKVTGDLGGDEITDVPKDVVWAIDHKKKTYTESKIVQPKTEREAAPAEREGKKEKSTVRVVRNEITVKGPGETKRIGEFECAHYTVVWILETEDTETKERGESTMTSDLWTTPETDATRALTREEREFNQAWLKKIGWDMTDKETQRMGLAMVGSLIGGDEESLKKGAREVAEKMEKIKGYPIGTGVKWQLKSSGGSATKQREEAPSGMPDISKGIGGLMSALGKKAAKGGAETGGAPDGGGAKTVFETYSEIRKISTAALPDADFLPPAGYRKVD